MSENEPNYIAREALKGLAEAAWDAAVEGDQLAFLNLTSASALADDMISCDADIETFADTHGYDWTHEELTRILQETKSAHFG